MQTALNRRHSTHIPLKPINAKKNKHLNARKPINTIEPTNTARPGLTLQENVFAMRETREHILSFLPGLSDAHKAARISALSQSIYENITKSAVINLTLLMASNNSQASPPFQKDTEQLPKHLEKHAILLNHMFNLIKKFSVQHPELFVPEYLEAIKKNHTNTMALWDSIETVFDEPSGLVTKSYCQMGGEADQLLYETLDHPIIENFFQLLTNHIPAKNQLDVISHIMKSQLLQTLMCVIGYNQSISVRINAPSVRENFKPLLNMLGAPPRPIHAPENPLRSVWIIAGLASSICIHDIIEESLHDRGIPMPHGLIGMGLLLGNSVLSLMAAHKVNTFIQAQYADITIPKVVDIYKGLRVNFPNNE